MAEITDCNVCWVGLRSSLVTTDGSYFFAKNGGGVLQGQMAM